MSEHNHMDEVHNDTSSHTPEQSVATHGPKNWVLPVSIIIAGLFIGGGIALGSYFSRTGGTPDPLVQLEKEVLDAGRASGMSRNDLRACLEAEILDETIIERLTTHVSSAIDLGASGTPLTLVVFLDDGSIIPVSGAQDKETFQEIITTRTSSLPVDDTLMLESFLPVNLDTETWIGSTEPRVLLVEYSDMNCQFCKRVHTTLKEIIAENTDVAWVWRHFPILQNSDYKAIAAECVLKDQGNEAFWEFINEMMK
jgi:hypothetical protein